MVQYFVSWYLHNSENNGWAYKVVNRYDDITAAKKAYHSELSNYIGAQTYDSVCVTLTDCYGNKIMSEWWGKPEEVPVEVTESEV